MIEDSDFPGLFNIDGSRVCYLDSAATSQKHRSFLDSFYSISCNYAGLRKRTCNKSLKTTFMYEKSREEAAKLISADENEIVFTYSTTDSINLVASSLYASKIFNGKKSIYVSWIDHHANLIPWINFAEKSGLELKSIPFDKNGKLDLNMLESLLDKDVFLLSLSHISNVTGNINPIKQVSEICKKNEILFFLDSAQSICHVKTDVKDLDVDFLAFSAHKFYGPNGVGVLYGKNEILEKMPPVRLGGGIVLSLEEDSFTYLPSPYKFESGTPAISQIIGFGEVLKWFKGLSIYDVEKHHHFLGKYLLDKLSMFPVNIFKDQSQTTPIVSMSFKEGFNPMDVQHFISLEEDICLRCGDLCAKGAMKFFNVDTVMRTSLSIYNKKEDVDVFVNALEIALKKIRSI